MDAFEMVRQLRARRNAIINHLPAPLQKELEEIDATIREIDDVLRRRGHQIDVSVPDPVAHLVDTTVVPPRPSRRPLAHRREALREYLAAKGLATRAQITADTGIPPGTLSALLTEPEFETVGSGLWRIQSAAKSDAGEGMT